MLKAAEIRRQVAQRLRELFPRARGWDETVDARIGSQTADMLVKFRLGEHEQSLVVDVASLGQPRQIRAAVTKLSEIRQVTPSLYPVAASVYIGPQSARILKDNNLGYVDLSGNCYLAFEHVLIEKEGKRNVRPSTRPLRSLFAPRATRVVRVLLAEPSRAWRLEELAKAAAVSLGHSHNVVKRLEDLRWVERDEAQRIHLGKPADLLEAWSESYTYRTNEIASYFAPERVTRRLMADLARAAAAARAISPMNRRVTRSGARYEATSFARHVYDSHQLSSKSAGLASRIRWLSSRSTHTSSSRRFTTL